ncbi:maltose alpha-D-glucosyltransferase [Chelativorans sp. M5D2P16]|uniref:maltose alpha-D-glucosyltransferase n=1 Tax=Chelativorans sp. M5D2P16 TaxID=3095678 RepID=UPI002ACA3F24|nr:maltose alpha-D-glucosyltransferase [Chelativorans sp. M5D2P16]MDZ5698232.1 maltose alpha-D-glucosyltransferase [Chelativorans sp. M5D2P16]
MNAMERFARGASASPGVDETTAGASAVKLEAPDWYKDAIIYQLHIKAFQDFNGDGIGDFNGLLQRLDYIERLGVNTIWLLPFYPSPLRDDGYDIADYRSINPSYGTMRDFRRFVDAAHRRGIRVITELVINHTSDQHPWFQRARRAKKGSAARNFYVWNDDDERYPETRIIFLDTETSNWTWDPVAGQFFWHRFYSHQPDLNFDNPRVLEEVIKVMRFWLDTGVDGLRLDAIPYLVEREGTNNENLPETHEVLKKIRAALDERYPDRMLLAEANQWPEDTRPYFGEGDECHMAFHFPLMPRIYMALAQEDRHPISDIMRQTPEIPEPCQWAIFLRNHDELTLEMVTDRERDYLWRTYADDVRARINLGIRRRLAPLMQNDRRKMELMNALLLSMPGTPVIYYGDELGMGDNIYLGDRDGVRTPMQWSMDRNGGFSRANPQALYLPPIMDPVYGYQTINVEAQEADPSSLLNWVRRMVAVRKQHRAFGRGDFTMLYPRNRRILAYTRSDGEETILCVVNLSRSAQAVELDLSKYRGRVPVELISQSPFPPIGDLPYMLTLSSYGAFWFLLADEAQAPEWHDNIPEPLPEFITLTLIGGRLERALAGREGRQLAQDVLPQFLQRQRWFGAKGEEMHSVGVWELARLGDEAGLLALVDVDLAAGNQRYLLPLTVLWGEENVQFGAPKLSVTLARVRKGAQLGALIDGAYDDRFAAEIMRAMQENREHPAAGGVLRFYGNERLQAMTFSEPPATLTGEQSNVSVAFGREALLKIFRRLRPGDQPEVDVARFLTEEAGFANTPAFLGVVEYQKEEGERTVLASVSAFVENQGDAWSVFVHALERRIEDEFLAPLAASAAPGTSLEADLESLAYPLDLLRRLGERTGEMHTAFAVDTDREAFRCEPVEAADIAEWLEDARTQVATARAGLERASAGLAPAAKEMAERLSALGPEIDRRLEAVAGIAPSGMKSRIHGDYHLGQVLVSEQDLFIIDFEGEPRRTLAERCAKNSPLRDVAGMLRSFDYAAWAAVRQVASRLPDQARDSASLARHWRDRMTSEFLAGYFPATEGARNLPEEPDARQALLDLFLLQKGFYEINYELSNRPDWVGIPIQGVLDLIEGGAT